MTNEKTDLEKRDEEIDKQIAEDELLEPEDRMTDEEFLESENYEFFPIEPPHNKN